MSNLFTPRSIFFVIFLLLLSSFAPVLCTDDPLVFEVIGWNLESGDIDPSVIAEQLASFEGIDLWGLSEVLADDGETFEAGIEGGEATNFESIIGTTGGGDRLQIVYDTGRFELLED